MTAWRLDVRLAVRLAVRRMDLSRDQAEMIVDFHSDEALQRRIEELACKANEGELTETERAEYLGYSQANNFI